MNIFQRSLLLLGIAGVLMTPVIADSVQLYTEPAGALMRIIGPADNPQARSGTLQWITPATADITRNRSGQPYLIQITKDGFQTETVNLDVRAKERTINIRLVPLRIEEQVTIDSTPAGAKIFSGDKVIGTTPLITTLTFNRANKNAAWSTVPLRASLADWQDESTVLTTVTSQQPVSFTLTRLHDVRQIKVIARNQQGDPIEKALVEVNGKVVAETPAVIELPFTRSDKSAPWPEFRVAAHIPDEYQRSETLVTIKKVDDLKFELTPVTEMNVVRYFPSIDMTTRGPQLTVDQTPTIGTAIDDRDYGTAAETTVRLTNYERKSPYLQALNSFTVTPDGQNLIYSVTYKNDQDKFYSNLHLRSTNPSNFTTVQLTRGPRFLDTKPTMCREADSNLVVFQSNRGRIETVDISSFRISDGRLVGGIQQLTRESRFNFEPTFVSEAQPIFFTSLEEFPEAEPRVSSVRADGSAYTNHGEVGKSLNYAESGRIYFARVTDDTKRDQLFSILADGTGSETLLSDTEFSVANCTSPAISPDGQRLVFVSDYNADREARKDNNIWILDLNGTRQPIQLTNNPSDDISPVWSPTEPDVLYFMSNRRGAYNIWKLTFRLVH